MALEASHFSFGSMEQPLGDDDDDEELEGGDDDLNGTGAIEDEAGEVRAPASRVFFFFFFFCKHSTHVL
jgi:hypothetical protein